MDTGTYGIQSEWNGVGKRAYADCFENRETDIWGFERQKKDIDGVLGFGTGLI